MYFERGKVHEALGGNEKALNDFGLTVYLEPENPLYYFHRGKFWFRMKRQTDAAADFKKAMELKPGYPDVIFFLIQNKLLKERQFQKALDACELLMKHHPEDKRGFYLRGIIRYKLGHYANAEYDFGMALHIDREYAAAYRYRGSCKSRQGDQTGAIQDLDTSLHLRNDYHQAFHDRATAWWLAGNVELAKADVDQAIELAGSESDAPVEYVLTRAHLWDAMFDPAPARRDFEQVLRRKPSALPQIPVRYRPVAARP
jgi:tetratricopeptide (TPR) repeat protein